MHDIGRFIGSRGRKIYFQCWLPRARSRAALLLAHGAGEHSGRYQGLAHYFVANGISVFALDHNGHGHSEGTPGHVEAFEDYLEDLSTFHRMVRSENEHTPVFLLGHSMGGLIGSNYLLQQQLGFTGCILSAPLIKTALEPGAVQTALIQLLARTAPRLGVLGLDANQVSRDPSVVARYVEDPLVYHGKMSARKLRELFVGMHRIADGAARITLPLLTLHGDADVLTDPKGSRFLHRAVSSADKTLKIYPKLYHEIFNEPERAHVLADVLSWCEARL